MNSEEMPKQPDTSEPKERKPTVVANDALHKVPNLETQGEDAFRIIKHVTAWVIVISAVLFALIGVLAVWDAFGTKANDVVWRAFSSLVIIAFAAFVVNIASRIAVGKH